jgi:hypothetical protein
MDGSAFDRLAREIAEPTGGRGSRRRLLGAAGGLSLAGVLGADDGDAARKHGRNRGHRPGQDKQRRQRRRSARRSKRRPEGFWTWRGISFELINDSKTRTVMVETGTVSDSDRCCQILDLYFIEPGETRRFETPEHYAFAWVNGKHWIQLDNYAFEDVTIMTAKNGYYGGDDPPTYPCCLPQGERDKYQPLVQNAVFETTLDDAHYTVHRLPDASDFKVFRIHIDLGSAD